MTHWTGSPIGSSPTWPSWPRGYSDDQSCRAPGRSAGRRDITGVADHGRLVHDLVIRPSAAANDLLSQLALVECRVSFLGDAHQLSHVLERISPLGELGEGEGEVSLFAATQELRDHLIR